MCSWCGVAARAQTLTFTGDAMSFYVVALEITTTIDSVHPARPTRIPPLPIKTRTTHKMKGKGIVVECRRVARRCGVVEGYVHDHWKVHAPAWV